MSRVAVVTGAAGAIGSAVCERLSAAGDTVIGLDAVADALTATAEAIACDVADEESVTAAFDTIRDRHGHPTVLVNKRGCDRRRGEWRMRARRPGAASST